MKLLAIFPIILIYSCSTGDKGKIESDKPIEKVLQNTNITAILDSISMEDIFADNPFTFETLSPQSFLNYINKPVDVTEEQILNIHDGESTDTLISLKWENSTVVFYRSSYNNFEFIDHADIYDSTFIFKNGINVGMSLEEVKAKFPQIKNVNKNYKYIELYYGDATNYTILFFENKRLKYIRYMPYTG